MKNKSKFKVIQGGRKDGIPKTKRMEIRDDRIVTKRRKCHLIVDVIGHYRARFTVDYEILLDIIIHEPDRYTEVGPVVINIEMLNDAVSEADNSDDLIMYLVGNADKFAELTTVYRYGIRFMECGWDLDECY